MGRERTTGAEDEAEREYGLANLDGSEDRADSGRLQWEVDMRDLGRAVHFR